MKTHSEVNVLGLSTSILGSFMQMQAVQQSVATGKLHIGEPNHQCMSDYFGTWVKSIMHVHLQTSYRSE